MVKKVIQVPVGEQLLKDLDNFSKKQHKTRSELIRQACLSYLQQIEYEELDSIYQQGYIRVPEKPEMGEIQAAMSGEFMSQESW